MCNEHYLNTTLQQNKVVLVGWKHPSILVKNIMKELVSMKERPKCDEVLLSMSKQDILDNLYTNTLMHLPIVQNYQQSLNLLYVAMTRAMTTLEFEGCEGMEDWTY